MRKSLLSLIIGAAAVLGAVSCSSRTDAGAQVADEFFFAFSAADYSKAMEYCDGDVRAAVQETAAMVDSLDAQLREAYIELSREVAPQRISVYEHSDDSLTVDYHTLIPGEIEPVCNAVTVVYCDMEQRWKVVDVK